MTYIRIHVTYVQYLTMYLYAVGMQELGVAMVWHVSRGSVHAVRQGQCYAQALRVSGL